MSCDNEGLNLLLDVTSILPDPDEVEALPLDALGYG